METECEKFWATYYYDELELHILTCPCCPEDLSLYVLYRHETYTDFLFIPELEQYLSYGNSITRYPLHINVPHSLLKPLIEEFQRNGLNLV